MALSLGAEFDQSKQLLGGLVDLSVAAAVLGGRAPELDSARDSFVSSALVHHPGNAEWFTLYANSLTKESRNDAWWREGLTAVLSSIDPATRAIVMAECCLANAWISVADLASGIGLRRLDACLDIVDVPFCAPDVQFWFKRNVDELSDAKLTALHTGAAVSLTAAAGFVGGLSGHFWMAPATGKIANLFLEQSSGWDETADEVARMLLCAMAATSVDAKSQIPAAVRSILFDMMVDCARRVARYSVQGATLTMAEGAVAVRRTRVVGKAHQLALELTLQQDVDPPQLTTPHLVGLPLDLAQNILASIGCDTDSAAPDSRTIMRASKWRVISQSSPASTALPDHVLLTALPWGEDASLAMSG